MAKTVFDKIWDAHEVAPGLLYVDLHLVHEVTSAQAFDGLRLAVSPRQHGHMHRDDQQHDRRDVHAQRHRHRHHRRGVRQSDHQP